MFTINGWKFDFKTMIAYKENPLGLSGRRAVRGVLWDPLLDKHDMIRISINYGIVFRYWPNGGPPESHFFDPRYCGMDDYDTKIVKAYTDWLFEQQVLLVENTDHKK